MKRLRLAALTMFALSFPLIAIMLSVHCHGAGSHSLTDSAFNGSTDSPLPVAAGQTITSLTLSPAVLIGKQKSTGAISLRYPAPKGGLVVPLHNSDRGMITPAQVVVPEGAIRTTFQLTGRPVQDLVATNISANYHGKLAGAQVLLLPSPKRQWFVSSSGNHKAQGTKESPWDLATALGRGPRGIEIQPGDTIWLQPGRYTGSFTSTLMGTQQQPIIVRALPGQRVIIDKGEVTSEKRPALRVNGSWVWFWGIEVTNSDRNRQRNSPYTAKDQPWRGSGADVYAPHVKFINMTFHDNGHGIWDKQDMTEIHGCLFFNNGNNKREHGLYIGNRNGTKYVTDNILFSQGGYGILAHSDSSASSQKGLHLEGNVSFNNGAITADDQRTGNLQVGGVTGEPAEKIVVKNNFVYNHPTNAPSKNYGIRLGYEDRSNKDIELANNYIVSKAPLLLWWWQNATVEGNTIYSTGDDMVELRMPDGVSSSSYKWNFNNYFSSGQGTRFLTNNDQTYAFNRWRQQTRLDQQSLMHTNGQPAGVQVFVRPNRYEQGRANIVVFNWARKDMVEVDLSGFLEPGVQFEIRDAQDYFGAAVVRGVYGGGRFLLPMKLASIAAPMGNVERQPRHTSSEFGVFVVLATGNGDAR